MIEAGGKKIQSEEGGGEKKERIKSTIVGAMKGKQRRRAATILRFGRAAEGMAKTTGVYIYRGMRIPFH